MTTATETLLARSENGHGAALAKPERPTSLKAWLQTDDFRKAVAQALPRHLTAERFIRAAITALTRTPDLAKCDQPTFLAAMLTLSQYGLEPDGRRAHLIPFRDNKRNCMTVQLIIDYKGLAELVQRSGIVSYVHADVVCENDCFEHDKGQITKHKIDFKKERGAVYAAYALCRFKDGTEKAEVMTRQEIEAIRGRSRAGRSGPWVTDWNEMAKKTVFRRLSKWLPLSSEIRDALEVDDDRIETEPATGLIPIPEGESKSDQLAEMLAAGAQSASGEESQVDSEPAGEESQVAPDRQPGEDDAPAEPTGSPEYVQADNLLDMLAPGKLLQFKSDCLALKGKMTPEEHAALMAKIDGKIAASKGKK